MKISTKTLWLAIHRIFSGERVDVGCSLSLKALMDAWRDSGLRQADLATGLESLMTAGFLGLENGIEGPVARLLDERFALLQPNAVDQQALATLTRLREVRKRPPGHIGALTATRLSGRRSTDTALHAR